MKYCIVRYFNGSKAYGKMFDSYKEAQEYLDQDEKVRRDELDGFCFGIEEKEG